MNYKEISFQSSSDPYPDPLSYPTMVPSSEEGVHTPVPPSHTNRFPIGWQASLLPPLSRPHTPPLPPFPLPHHFNRQFGPETPRQ